MSRPFHRVYLTQYRRVYLCHRVVWGDQWYRPCRAYLLRSRPDHRVSVVACAGLLWRLSRVVSVVFVLVLPYACSSL